METSNNKRDHLQQLRDYFHSVKQHLGLLTASSVVVAGAELLRAELAPEWIVPPWIRVAAWVLAITPAQYLAWRDAWEAKGIPEKPFASRGLQVTWHAGREDYYDEEAPDVPTTPGPPCSYTRITADTDLRGRALEVYFSEDFRLSQVNIYHIKSKGKTGFLPSAVRPLAACSFVIDMRGYRAFPNLEMTGLEIQIETEPLPKVVRVEEIHPPRKDRLSSWFRSIHAKLQ